MISYGIYNTGNNKIAGNIISDVANIVESVDDCGASIYIKFVTDKIYVGTTLWVTRQESQRQHRIIYLEEIQQLGKISEPIDIPYILAYFKRMENMLKSEYYSIVSSSEDNNFKNKDFLDFKTYVREIQKIDADAHVNKKDFYVALGRLVWGKNYIISQNTLPEILWYIYYFTQKCCSLMTRGRTIAIARTTIDDVNIIVEYGNSIVKEPMFETTLQWYAEFGRILENEINLGRGNDLGRKNDAELRNHMVRLIMKKVVESNKVKRDELVAFLNQEELSYDVSCIEIVKKTKSNSRKSNKSKSKSKSKSQNNSSKDNSEILGVVDKNAGASLTKGSGHKIHSKMKLFAIFGMIANCLKSLGKKRATKKCSGKRGKHAKEEKMMRKNGKVRANSLSKETHSSSRSKITILQIMVIILIILAILGVIAMILIEYFPQLLDQAGILIP